MIKWIWLIFTSHNLLSLRYRKILGSQAPTPAQPTIISSPTRAPHPRSISPTSVSLSPSRASLAQEWRSSLASLAGGSAGSSPLKLIMNTTPTPGAATEWSVETSKESQRRLESEDMDSILVSRLDMLMHNSMTLRYFPQPVWFCLIFTQFFPVTRQL